MINYLINKALYGAGDSDQHLLVLFSLVVASRSKNILELGVRSGDSTMPLLMGAKATGGILNSVDITNTTFSPNEEYKSHWNFHQMNSIDYLKSVNQKLDLVFIDDWHDGLHVFNEISLIEPWATKETIILLHDTMHTFRHPNYNNDPGDPVYFSNYGPYGALLKLDRQKWEYATLPYNHGLTLLRKYE